MAEHYKAYIGDGVYAAIDDFGSIILTTENGVSVTNRIVLELEVTEQLLGWLTDTRKRMEGGWGGEGGDEGGEGDGEGRN